MMFNVSRNLLMGQRRCKLMYIYGLDVERVVL